MADVLQPCACRYSFTARTSRADITFAVNLQVAQRHRVTLKRVVKAFSISAAGYNFRFITTYRGATGVMPRTDMWLAVDGFSGDV